MSLVVTVRGWLLSILGRRGGGRCAGGCGGWRVLLLQPAYYGQQCGYYPYPPCY